MNVLAHAPAGALGSVMVALVTAGCGGDVGSSSSNRGVNSHTSPISVENAYIEPTSVEGRCALQRADTAELRFTISNSAPTGSDRLRAVRTDVARRIDIPAAAMAEIPAGQSLAVDQPIAEPANGSATRSVAVGLSGLIDAARPGTSTPVTFAFQNYGELTLRVPVEACPSQS